jgi:hypothetical protein
MAMKLHVMAPSVSSIVTRSNGASWRWRDALMKLWWPVR